MIRRQPFLPAALESPVFVEFFAITVANEPAVAVIEGGLVSERALDLVAKLVF